MPTIKTDITGLGDPFVLNHNGTYYMYATTSSNGFKVYTSTDLVSWQDNGLCYHKNQSFAYECFWAPEVVVRDDGMFVMHFSARDNATKGLRIGVATASCPLGPFVDATPGKPMFDLGYATIDAHCFCDVDGKNYLFFVRDVCDNVQEDGVTHLSQIYVAPLDKTLTTLASQPQCVLSPSGDDKTASGTWHWNEGPFVLYHNGTYHLNYSYNCYDMADYSVGVATAKSVLGPYTKTNSKLLKKMDGFSGPGHNAYFVDNNGKLMCAFHIHTDPNKPSGDRRACFAPAEFNNGVLTVLYD